MIGALKTLEALLPQANAVRKGAQFKSAVEAARHAVDEAQAIPERLQRVSDALETIASFPTCPRDDLRQALIAVVDVATRVAVANDAQALHVTRHELQQASSALEAVEKGIVQSWNRDVERAFTPLKRLGAVLARMHDTATAGKQLEAWADRALALRRTAVPTEKDVAVRAKAIAGLPERIAELEKLGIDADVRNFLQRAAAREATLASVTVGVLAWLEKRGASDRFRVQLD